MNDSTCVAASSQRRVAAALSTHISGWIWSCISSSRNTSVAEQAPPQTQQRRSQASAPLSLWGGMQLTCARLRKHSSGCEGCVSSTAPFPVNPTSRTTQSTTVTLNRQSQNCASKHHVNIVRDLGDADAGTRIPAHLGGFTHLRSWGTPQQGDPRRKYISRQALLHR